MHRTLFPSLPESTSVLRYRVEPNNNDSRVKTWALIGGVVLICIVNAIF
jgi:hypothetical protein